MNKVHDAVYQGNLVVTGDCHVKGNMTVMGTLTVDVIVENIIYKDVEVTSIWQAIKLLWRSRELSR